VKIAVFSLPEILPGKHNIKDSRLDEVCAITKSKKKTYMQIEVVAEEEALDAHVVLVSEGASQDLILKDLEFIETRASRTEDEQEKALLQKLKGILEKETFIANAGLSDEEKKRMSGYGLLTDRPVVVARKDEAQDPGLLARAVREGGFISFFTTGEKETRAWLIKAGTTAWEAAGSIHSDIQKGFIRAEIISLADFIQAGGETQAKQAGKMRLESKDYVMQDADLTNFRFSK
jgi:ribosome-binding ATPase YchF (GTP1/OBG family)